MRIKKEDVPVKIDAPGALARQQTGFGDSTGYGELSGEYFSLGAGADITPLLCGLKDDLCQCPHWGYLLSGNITVIYGDKSEDKIGMGDLFYMPEGHTVKADADSELIMFSPQKEHTEVINHLLEKMKG